MKVQSICISDQVYFEGLFYVARQVKHVCSLIFTDCIILWKRIWSRFHEHWKLSRNAASLRHRSITDMKGDSRSSIRSFWYSISHHQKHVDASKPGYNNVEILEQIHQLWSKQTELAYLCFCNTA